MSTKASKSASSVGPSSVATTSSVITSGASSSLSEQFIVKNDSNTASRSVCSGLIKIVLSTNV